MTTRPSAKRALVTLNSADMILAVACFASPAFAQSPPSASAIIQSELARKASESTSRTLAENAVAPEGRVRAVVRPGNEAILSARMTGLISRMPHKEGDAFAKDDVLVEFDCERQINEAKAAEATVNIQKKTVETNQELDKFASIGKNDLLISISQLDKAIAEHQALNAQLKACKLLAPFAGRIVSKQAWQHETVNVSQPLLKVLDTGSQELEMLVPSSWLKWLRIGARYKFKVDETGSFIAGEVTRINPSIDAVSNSVRMIGSLRPTPQGGPLMVGMSGNVTFLRGGGN